MENGSVDDIIREAADVADQHVAKLERTDARALISDVFALLPWELQEDYREIQDMYNEGRREEANRAWEAWMDKAREMGLI